MGCRIEGYYRVKKQGVFPWPCRAQPDRVVELRPHDVLLKAADGTYTKHTGLMLVGLQVNDDAVEWVDKVVRIDLI